MEKVDYSQGWSSHTLLPLDEALKHGITDCECYVYKISIPVEGGSTYVGFTTQDPKERLAQHLDSARSDSFNKVHQELRRFGFLHEFEIIGKYNNEVMGLISEIATIKKYWPTLNRTIGGEGNHYSVILQLNHLNERVFFVQDNLAIKRHDDELEARKAVLEKLKRVGVNILRRHKRRLSKSKSIISETFDNQSVALKLLDKIFYFDQYQFDDLVTNLSGENDEILTMGKASLLAKRKKIIELERKINSLIEPRDSAFYERFREEVESLSEVDNYLAVNGFAARRNIDLLYDFLPTSDCKEKHYWTQSIIFPRFKSRRDAQRFIQKIRNDGVINHEAISEFTLAWRSFLGLSDTTKARFYPNGRTIPFSGRDVFPGSGGY